MIVIFIIFIKHVFVASFFIVYHFHHVFNCVAASWKCDYQKYMFWSQFNSDLSRMASSSMLFLSIIVVVPHHHHCRSSQSSSLFLSIIVVVPPSWSDTRHPSSKRLGRGSNAKTSRNSEILRTNWQMDKCTETARCRRLKSKKSDASSKYCCRGVGGGILPPTQPLTPSRTLTHADKIQQQGRVFHIFNSNMTDGWLDQCMDKACNKIAFPQLKTCRFYQNCVPTLVFFVQFHNPDHFPHSFAWLSRDETLL